MCEFEPGSWRCILDITVCNQVCQLLATDRCLSPDTLISSTYKTDRHHITEILLEVGLRDINQTYFIKTIVIFMITCYFQIHL